MAKKSPVRSQMTNTPPSPAGVSTNIHQYGCPPFSKHPHSEGGGGIPTTVEVKTGGKLPTTTPPSLSSPKAATGSPAPGTRRYSKT